MSANEGDKSSQFGLWRLKVVVILCGAVLMSLEMAGVRVLNVHFGSTHYVWGSIIGIFLAALSFGYYIGGMAADRWPRFPVLGFLILLAALFHFLVPQIARPVCEWLVSCKGMDPRVQAILGSVILYFIPSVLLGTVSPFAVRLAADKVSGIGSVAGRLYALSTIGSIVGTFLTSFFLIEIMGIALLIYGLGVALVVAAALTIPARGKALTLACVLMLGGGLSPLAFGGTPALVSGKTLASRIIDAKLLEEFDSSYHHILVAEGKDLIDARYNSTFLLFNTQVQSGLKKEGPGTENGGVVSACGYAEFLHLGMLFRNDVPRKVLIIGCGGGVAPLTFLRDYPGIEKMDVVDIDPAVFSVASKYFGYPAMGSKGVIQSHIEDGRLFVQRSGEKYDYIVLDAYSAGGRIPFHLATKEFMAAVKERLTPDGVLVMNLISAIQGDHGRLFRAASKTMHEVFPAVCVFPREGALEDAQNIFLVCPADGKSISEEDAARRLARKQDNLIKRPALGKAVRNLLGTRYDSDADPLLTDDYAPTDGMTYQ